MSGRGFAAAEAYSPRPLTAGERWTAEALAALRRGGYGPRSWVQFLRSALERSAENRRARPELVRQARGWGVAGAAGWVGAWAFLRPRLGLFRPLAWWLAVWQMLDWHLGMAEGGDGRPRGRLSPADAITLTRFWLVPALQPSGASPRVLSLVILAGGATDWADGIVARRHGRTRLGRDLDTTADLAFLTASAASARAAGRLTRLGAWSIGLRYALGVALALGAVFGRARRPAIRARPWGGALRVAGLVLSAAGRPRAGTLVLVIGCAIPPRSTAPRLSLA